MNIFKGIFNFFRDQIIGLKNGFSLLKIRDIYSLHDDEYESEYHKK